MEYLSFKKIVLELCVRTLLSPITHGRFLSALSRVAKKGATGSRSFYYLWNTNETWFYNITTIFSGNMVSRVLMGLLFADLNKVNSKVWRIQAKKKSSKPITNKVRNFSSSRVINKFCINSLRNRTESKYIFFYPLKFFLSLRLEKSFILWIPHFTNLKFFLPRPTSET